MKKFPKIIDGIRYQNSCPMCSAKMRIDKGAISDVRSFNYPDSEHKNGSIIFKIESNSVIVDLSYDDINSIIEYKEYNPLSNIGEGDPTYTHYTLNTPLPREGSVALRLVMSCSGCDMYGYALQIILSMDELIISDISLNEERMYFEIPNSDNYFEIVNLYGCDRTHFYKVDKYRSKNPVLQLPLIPMNLQNPEATLKRIKNLLVFS